jgi:phage terminase large subunit GpA-like protein
LKWENLKWEKSETGEHLPETAHFRCVENGCRIEEHHKKQMIDGGEWIAERPFKGKAGFHIWTAYSLFPNANWSQLVEDWLAAYKVPNRRKAFVNTTLGETYQDAVEVTDPDILKNRAEPYNWETLPSDARLVTFGADTQDDRIEATWVAWGANGESWVARHEVVYGDTSKFYVWDEFDKILLQPLGTDDGRVLLAQAGCVDSGGHRTEMVYKFCRDRKRRRIYATIGRGNSDPRHPKMIWPKTASRGRNASEKPVTVGVDTAKDDISSRLAIVPAIEGPTPRAIHFPMVGLSGDYYEQLTSEHAVVDRNGATTKRSWKLKELGRRNEAWDCLVLALAARLSLPIKLDKPLAKNTRARPVAEDENVGAVAVDEPVVAQLPAAVPIKPRRADRAPKAANDNPPKKRERAQWAAYK